MRVLVFLLLLTVAFPLFGQQQIRKWSDKSGEFTVRAKLVKVEGETVTLEKEAGGTVEVPIAKLSDKDREFVEKLSAAKPTKKSPTKNRTEPIQEIIYPTKDFWEIKPGGRSFGTLPSNRIELPQSINYASYCIVSPNRDQLLVAGNHQFFRGDNYQIAVFDLTAGKQISEFEVPVCTPVGISPNNRFLLVLDNPDTLRDPSHVLSIYQFNPSVKKLVTWRPYDGNEVVGTSETDLVSAWFVDDEHVLTINRGGNLRLWNFVSGANLVWHAKIRPFLLPALSPDRRMVFVVTTDKLIVLDSLTGQVLAQTATDAKGLTSLSINEDGTKMVGMGNGRAQVWDLSRPTVIHDFAISAIIQRARRILWLSDDQVLVNCGGGEYELIDLNLRGSICCYGGFVDQLSHDFDNMLWRNISIRSKIADEVQQTLLPVPLPHDGARSQIAAFESMLDIDIGPGDEIGLELTTKGVDHNKEYGILAKLFNDAGYRISTSGTAPTFHARMEMGHGLPRDPGYVKGALEITLKVGESVIWRSACNSENFDSSKDSYWQGFTIPRTFRLIKQPLKVWQPNQLDLEYKQLSVNRDYSTGLVSRMIFDPVIRIPGISDPNNPGTRPGGKGNGKSPQ